ncbi:Uncharacterized protein SCF082_LOCUS32651 [Durusdinium trenchii]|uniref:Uncharacterized protein n=1 Tax=Durusdinium trenchii TaxID=1381693 RepID=A0ABP0NGD0_9DINO
MAFSLTSTDASFRNLSLSFRGAERQAPSVLQVGLRFSQIMEQRALDGTHATSMTTEERLRDVTAEFNQRGDLHQKNRVDEDRFRSILNLISGTSEASREVIRAHLDHAKWRESAFSTDQLRGSRWMIGTSPKSASRPPELKRCLTVTEESQCMHLQLVVQSYVESGRRLRPSARSKMRLTPTQFDAYADFAAVYATTLQDARLLATWTPEKEAAVKKAFMQKDYFPDVEAAVASKLSTWKLSHLGLWSDLVEPPATPVKIHNAQELMEMEDSANAAKFREIRAKLAQDCAAMTAFNANQAESKRRAHVVMVMHEKGQMQVGKELCENYMERACRVSLVTQAAPLDPKIDQLFRNHAVAKKVTPQDLDCVLCIDCTKMGVINQLEVNMIGELADKVLSKNPTRTCLVLIPPLLVGSDAGGSLRKDIRKIEDKLLSAKVELRPWTLNLNTEDLHKNRDTPAAYLCFIGVLDASLPTKGTVHRNVRGNPENEQEVNVFCNSPLWLRQSLLPSEFPKALPESSFVVPGDFLHSNDMRRNYTDFQETAQWCGGVQVPKAVLGALCSGLKASHGVVVVHPTTYDGCLELAALQLGHVASGTSWDETCYKTSKEVVKTHLLQEVRMEDLPRQVEPPTLHICQLADSRLILPRDIRQLFLQDVMHSPEWREILQKFDRDWGSAEVQTPSSGPTVKPEVKSEVKSEEEIKSEPCDLSGQFQGSPKTLEKVKEKYGADNVVEMTAFSNTSLLLVPGPHLFIMAKESVDLKGLGAPIIAHGAGVWLVGEKAKRFEASNAGKGIPCKFTSDQAACVLEDDSGDGKVATLRAVLHAVERSGMVEFTLGGHSCSRPPDVKQGRCDDYFNVAPEGDELLWRPNTVQAKSLKSTNLASHFTFTQLHGSSLRLVWQMRKYVTEKCVAAAKPLWYLPGDMKLGKGECQQLI